MALTRIHIHARPLKRKNPDCRRLKLNGFLSHHLELLCNNYHHHTAIVIRLSDKIPNQYTELIFHGFPFQDTISGSGSLGCRHTQERLDTLVLCLVFLLQRRNATAVDDARD